MRILGQCLMTVVGNARLKLFTEIHFPQWNVRWRCEATTFASELVGDIRVHLYPSSFLQQN